MRRMLETFLAGLVTLLAAFSLQGQTTNLVWFVTSGGIPSPTTDVSVRTLRTDGSATPLAGGAVSNFLSQVDFPSLNSPADIAVDPTLGKIFVLDDNNVQFGGAEYIYSFNLFGTPVQRAASRQVVYTLPVPAADVASNRYPLLAGIALDPVNHYLYFSQLDLLTATNSYVGRLDLAGSSKCNLNSYNSADPVLHTYYVGQIPGKGQLTLSGSTLYLSAVNGLNGTNGIFSAPANGVGAITQIITNSTGNLTFTNGIVAGVAVDQRDHLIYYLTFNAGIINGNGNYNLGQNAVWTFSTINHAIQKLGSGYSGSPNNLALDVTNNRYYFTVGMDSTGNPFNPTNSQGIYTGTLNTTNAPALLHAPVLTGLDVNGQFNAGNVDVRGICVMDYSLTNHAPVGGSNQVSAVKNKTITLPAVDLLTKAFDADGDVLFVSAVNVSSSNGGLLSLSGNLISFSPASNFVGQDQFYYTLTDSQGAQAQGTVGVNVIDANIPAANALSVNLTVYNRLLMYSGISGHSYVFQYANALNGTWYDLSTPFSVSGPSCIQYNDPSSLTNAMRFYRVRY